MDGLSPWIILWAASTICQFDLLEKFYCIDHLKLAQIKKKLTKLEAMKKWLPSSSSSGTINWGQCISNWWVSMKLWLDMNLISDSQPELGTEISLEKGEEISYEKRKIDMKNSSPYTSSNTYLQNGYECPTLYKAATSKWLSPWSVWAFGGSWVMLEHSPKNCVEINHMKPLHLRQA